MINDLKFENEILHDAEKCIFHVINAVLHVHMQNTVFNLFY